jgi:hypothetical protein
MIRVPVEGRSASFFDRLSRKLVRKGRPMSAEQPKLPLLHQREIEAGIVGPLVQAFASEFGRERTLAIVREVITQLARHAGAELARTLGEHSLEAFAKTLDRWRENDALEIEVLERSSERLSFNVVRCRYAEMYRALSLTDLGAALSCQRDFALAEGFNPDIKLARTQTLLEGAPFCDFRFQRQQVGCSTSGPCHSGQGESATS